MRHLPLYAAVPASPLDAAAPLDADPACERCALHDGAHTRCLPAEGRAGGLLVVGDAPSAIDDRRGRPFGGDSGDLLRATLAQHWSGPVALTTAVRCAPGSREVTASHVAACRGFLAAVVRDVAPTRILVLGGDAALSVLGRSIAPLNQRRSYGHLLTDDGAVPVLVVPHPTAALRNRHVRRWFDADVRWALTAAPRPLPLLGRVALVESDADAEEAVSATLFPRWSAFDVETAGRAWDRWFRLLCVAVHPEGSGTTYVWDRAALADPGASDPLLRWAADDSAPKVGAHVQFDVQALRAALGVDVRGIAGDVRLWRKLLDTQASGALDDMAELVGMGGTKEEAGAAMDVLVKRARSALQADRRAEDARASGARPPRVGPVAQEALDWWRRLAADDLDLAACVTRWPAEPGRWRYGLLDREDRATLLRYCARDAVATARVATHLLADFARAPDLQRVGDYIVDPAARAIAHVERWGVAVDVGAVRAFDAHLTTRIADVRKRLDAYGFEGFDPASTASVRAVLYGDLKLSPAYETATGLASTDADALAELDHPFARDLVEWRKLERLRGTYAVGLLDHVRDDGRIHTSILLDGAATGRTSSAQPNLQNQPSEKRDPEFGAMARNCFVAPPGHKLVSLDYSQIELRVAAMLSGDAEMIAIFRSGVDYHQRTAELISKVAWGIAPARVEKRHRGIAKNINFACLYNAGDEKIAAMAGCSLDEARRAKTAILGKFRRFAEWCDEQVAEARRTGYVWTRWAGERARRRSLWRIGDHDDAAAAAARNAAINTPVQGTASDYLIASLAACVDWISDGGLEDRVKLVLPVHDQLLFEVRDDHVPVVVETARRIMTSWPSEGVPLVVDVETGQAWGSLQHYEEAAA